jgi:outer membrane protein insertion porin family
VLGTRVVAHIFATATLCAARAVLACGQLTASTASGNEARGKEFEANVRWAEVRIEFEGNRVFKSKELSNTVWVCVNQYRHSDAKFKFDLLDYCLRKDVLDSMRSIGFLSARVGEYRMQETWPGLIVTVPIEEGALYRVGKIKIEGAEFFPAKQLRELLPFKGGDLADSRVIIRWAYEHLKKLYADNGFIQYEAEIEPEFRLEPGADDGIVDFLVTISEGRQVVLRKVELKGSERASEDVLRKAMLIKEGEVFSEQKFKDSIDKLNNLLDSDVFEDVDVNRDSDFRTDKETGDLFITIRLKE